MEGFFYSKQNPEKKYEVIKIENGKVRYRLFGESKESVVSLERVKRVWFNKDGYYLEELLKKEKGENEKNI